MNKVEISFRIKEYFLKLGWTKAKFSRAIGEYPQHLEKVFTGKLDPFKYIDKLVAMGCDKDWLLTGEEKEKHIMKEEKIEYISNEVEHLKLELKILKDLYVKEQIDFKKRIKERDKKLEKLQAENEKLKTDNNKLRVGGALINSKGVTGSVKRGGP